ncbi:MAG: protein kinase [Clostridia bacterium]|nr:protein kinase [Clostridia bacterium]
MNIKGYELIGDWKVANRGFTVQSTKGGKKYFLKKYGMYKMPRRDSSTAEVTYNRMKAEFESFMENRININKTLADLAGPGGNIILPTHWFVDDICYIEATEFVNDLIEDEDILNLSIEDKIFIMLTAAAALYNIHKKKIVHSDLKRTNILAARNGSGRISAKIIDFDASYFENDIRPEELGGDQNFMSPELAWCLMSEMSEEALDYLSAKSDIFSLGLVFHDYLVTEKCIDDDGKRRTRGCHPKIEGLTGKLKERADAGKTVYCCEALLSDGKLVVSDKITKKYLRHLIAAMLQPEPEDRPTAQEVLDVLKNKKVLDIKSDAIIIQGEETVSHISTEDATPTVPTDFCEPWPEHGIAFERDKLNDSGYIASERVEKSGLKCYNLYKRDGTPRLFSFENLLLLGMVRRTSKPDKDKSKPTTPSPTATSTSEIIVHDDGKLWEEDKAYRFDDDAVKNSGYKGIARAERKGLKGYVLIKPSGEQRFMTVDKLKILRFVLKK